MSITFGRTSSGGSYSELLADYAYVGKFVLSEAMSLERIYAQMSQGAVSGHFKGFIYADNAGVPDALVATSSAVSLAANSAKAWRYGTATATLAAGTYWIGIVVDTGYSNLWRDATSGTAVYGENDYSSPTDPWSGGTPYTRYLCVYAYGSPAGTLPGAPTLTRPISSQAIEIGLPQLFSWTFNPGVGGDTQSAYQLRWRLAGTTAWTGGVAKSTSPYGQTTVAGATFTAAEWEWQAKTWNQLGVEGPWSASSYFTGSDAAVVVITSPSDSATVSDPLAPLVWTASDQETAAVRRVADDGGDPDPGTVYETASLSAGDRSFAWTLDTTGRWEHWQVAVTSGGVTTDWQSVRVYIDYTPPATPTLVLDVAPSLGAVDLFVTNPAPTGGQPTVVAMDVYMTEGDAPEIRIARDVYCNDYVYWALADSVVYQFRVQVIGDNGARAFSALEA